MDPERRWELCVLWLAETAFEAPGRPDPAELGALLRGLGVSLEQLERFVAVHEPGEDR